MSPVSFFLCIIWRTYNIPLSLFSKLSLNGITAFSSPEVPGVPSLQEDRADPEKEKQTSQSLLQIKAQTLCCVR